MPVPRQAVVAYLGNLPNRPILVLDNHASRLQEVDEVGVVPEWLCRGGRGAVFCHVLVIRFSDKKKAKPSLTLSQEGIWLCWKEFYVKYP